MILVPHCSGQTCNKIVYFVQALALALDCKRDLTYFFGKDIRSFSDLHPEAIPNIKVKCFDRQRSKIVDGVCGMMEWKLPGMRERYYNTNVERIRKFAARPKWLPIILWNWNFRNDAGIVRHREAICAYLRAKDGYIRRAHGIVSEARKDAEIVVGVHIRRGDYKNAYQGRYYYDDATYLNFMKDLRKAIDRKVRFVIVSNEPIDIPYFTEHGINAINASGSAQEDIVTLSECDYIMGPPSTFSWWASYYGGKPRLMLTSPSQAIDLREFEVPTRLVSSFQ